MLTNISWEAYCITIAGLLFVYYAFLGFHFYYKEIKQAVSGEADIKLPSFGRNKPGSSLFKRNNEISRNAKFSFSPAQSQNALDAAGELSDLLAAAINECSESKLSKDDFQNRLRQILSGYAFVKNSALRRTLNELMASECEKHPQLILTYAEVDGLWDEAI